LIIKHFFATNPTAKIHFFAGKSKVIFRLKILLCFYRFPFFTLMGTMFVPSCTLKSTSAVSLLFQ